METFVVRIWQPATKEPAPLAGLHGTVQHVGCGDERAFTDDAELLAILRVTTVQATTEAEPKKIPRRT